MKFYKKLLLTLLGVGAAMGASAIEKIIVVNEGLWQSDNGTLSYFEDGRIVSNEWFREVNGEKLGDTPNDIILVHDNLEAVAIGTSGIVQFIDGSGKAVAATEDVPNNRKLASDGKYVYVTSYAHECTTVDGVKNFTKGYVAKIDVETFKVVSAVEVGYEPEGIALYNGHLFVANSGGYSYQGDHEYESTVSVIDAGTMTVKRTVDTGQINLSGIMSRSGQYLCINSPGDYYEVQPATIIMDCNAVLADKADAECCVKLNYASTYNTTAADGSFYAIGSVYSYATSAYQYNYLTIDPKQAMESAGSKGVTETLPGSLVEDIKKMTTPYGIYVNPYSGYIYGTDACGSADAGMLYQWSPAGELLGTYKVYINPGHFLALPTEQSGIKTIADGIVTDQAWYTLQGIRVAQPVKGHIYIHNGKKIAY